MYKLKTSIELPIAHCLYRGAYSGLCCGNVYRDKGQCDGKNDRYDLGDKVLPILHGHNYIITITVESENLDKNNMVIDFKQLKKVIHEYFDQYDHSMILTPDNPLVEVYKKNFAENGIDFERSRLFVWPENPTAEYMSKYWHDCLTELLNKEMHKTWLLNNNACIMDSLTVEVEETTHNSVTYTD